MHELIKVWLYVGLVSFGGPAAQIALMHRIIVDEKKWLTEKDFLQALNFCMLLPGPEAMQLATYCGWKQRGVIGGLISGGLFVLPGAILIAVLAALYVHYAALDYVQVAFLGIKAAIIVIVIQALYRISQKALKNHISIGITLFAFAGMFILDLPYPLIIIGAALAGYFLLPRRLPHAHLKPNVSHHHLRKTLVIGLFLWFTPLIIIYLIEGKSMLFEMGLFFSKLAVVTFGGAYAVLAYMTSALVQDYAWLSTAQMIDGLGLAETTPGPLILVTEFSAYIAAYFAHGTHYAILAALLTLWVTFIPCFIWIFMGAPYLDWLASKSRLQNTLDGITAAVVGVMLNLSIWFALHVYFGQISKTSWNGLSLVTVSFTDINWQAIIISLFAGYVIFKAKQSILTTLLLCVLLALILPLF